MSKSGKSNSVRIISGNWRGRRLAVADVPGLRPSGDRCRETLFNWLQPRLRGARCVDLFAGSGALGLEAASRGAARVVLVEQAAVAARTLTESVGLLLGGDVEGVARVEVVRGDALRWLQECAPASIDIAFVDPPFGSDLADRTLRLLQKRGLMAPEGLVYLETARQSPAPSLPPGWTVRREKTLGEVRMQLFACPAGPKPSESSG